MRKDRIFPLVFTILISQLVRALPIFFLLIGLPIRSHAELPLHLVKLPLGFTISVYAENVDGARSMTLSPAGTLFVGSLRKGNVYALTDRNHDNKADNVSLIAQGLNAPNGVAFRDGALYVAEINRILRFDNIEERLENPPQPVVVNETLPSDRHHGWKFIKFGPDDLLYVPVGAPCNVCERDDERYASLLRMNPDGSGLEIFARGIRNTVGFDWHPDTQVLWFTDNGRDMLGDDAPPDELNYASEKGMHFGFPYCHGRNIPDPRFGEKRKCDEFTPPALQLGPHVAAIGMRFYVGSMFPPKYYKQIFIAEHGSWNRSTPLGYRISSARLEDNGAMQYDIFAEGWLQDGGVWGRPVDVQVMADGALLVSDDFANAVYRISYAK